jgi:hypothetical protein
MGDEEGGAGCMGVKGQGSGAEQMEGSGDWFRLGTADATYTPRRLFV